MPPRLRFPRALPVDCVAPSLIALYPALAAPPVRPSTSSTIRCNNPRTGNFHSSSSTSCHYYPITEFLSSHSNVRTTAASSSSMIATRRTSSASIPASSPRPSRSISPTSSTTNIYSQLQERLVSHNQHCIRLTHLLLHQQ